MRRFWMVTVLTVVSVLCACASGGKTNTASSGAVDLDTAILQAGMEMNDTLPSQTKVALLNFTSASDVFSDYVLVEMETVLVKERKIEVVDRKEMDLIRGEMNFQMSGEVSDSSAQSIGHKLGAQYIVSGSLVNMGKTHRFRTRVINVESAKVEVSSSISVADDPQIQHLLSQGGKTSAPKTATASGGTQATPAQAVTTTYKIGDTGPAGGLIFYDKGNNSGGWRYLEAAPADLPRVLAWASEDIDIDRCKERAVGKGKSNTQVIMAEAAKKGGGFGWAAQACVALTVNDFNDWFLPSQDELHYMYGNLHMQGKGDFRNERYWSSTVYRWANVVNGVGYNMQIIYEDFTDGKQVDFGYEKTYNVRPIRQVAGQ